MKIKLIKIQIVSLAVFVFLGTCSLINGVPVRPAANNQMTSDLLLSRNFPHRRLPVPQIQQPQGSVGNTSLPENTQGSNNWAGYIDAPSSGSSFTSVSGSWTVPNITASQQNAVAAQWIGLGGVSSSDLLQMGTMEQIENGKPVAKLFWEQLPSAAQNVMTVPIGSTISASITPAADSDLTWNLTFTVNGQSQTQKIPPVSISPSYATGIGTSAEWISEDPSNGNSQLYPLANMGTVSYNSAMANGQPLKSAGTAQPVAMVSSNGTVMIAPSELGTDGESFSTKVITTNTRPAQGYSQNGNSWPLSNWRQGFVSISRGYQGNNFVWIWEW
jgi:Peptidase A4 family.